jgi:hypothetical protein
VPVFSLTTTPEEAGGDEGDAGGAEVEAPGGFVFGFVAMKMLPSSEGSSASRND